MNKKLTIIISVLLLIAAIIFLNTKDKDNNAQLNVTAYKEPNVEELNEKIKILREKRKEERELEAKNSQVDQLARMAERDRNQTEGYGKTEPIEIKDANGNYLASLSPQIKSLAQAVESGEKPNQVSILISAKPFDKNKWDTSQAYKDNYMTALEPGRVFQSSSDKKATKLEAISKFYTEIIQETGEAIIEVKGKPGYPISAFSPDLGEFSNQLTTQTLIADTNGKATFKFKGPSGTIADCNLIMSSPVCMGQLKFIVHVRKPIEDSSEK